MSIYDKASLVLIPSGTKTSKVYSQKPVSGDGDFTFTRASAATRISANGNIEKETSNLLLQSNSFDTTWGPSSSISVTGGQSGYDGTSDAWLLKRSDASARYINQNITLGSSVYTYSVYAKPESENWMYFWSYNGSGSVNAYFDLQNGVVGNTSGLIDATIVAAGNGYYRCSITYNNNIASVRIYPAVANGSITGGIVGAGIYIQDAQLEQGLVARDYIETTTTAVYGGITDNTPRLDYTDSSCPSLKLEPQRTNLATLSEYFEGWSHKPNTTATSNYTTSPEGLTNATRLEFTGNGYLYNINSPTQVNGTEYTLSCYAKRNDSGTQSFGFFTNGSGSVNSAMTLTSEWKRFDYTYTATNASQLGLAGSSGADVSVFGFQVEASASYATSYIPTYGSSVTFAAESNSVTGISSLINNSEGTLFIEAATLENGADCRITYSDGTISNRVSIEWDANADTIKGFIGVGGNLETTSYDQTIMNKIALVYNATDARLFINGTKVFTDSSVPSLSGMDRLEFSNYGGALPFVGNTKQLLILKEKLTDQEAIDLTTI